MDTPGDLHPGNWIPSVDAAHQPQELLWGAPVVLPAQRSTGVAVWLQFDTPRTVALDWQLPDPRSQPVSVGFRVTTGFGRASRVAFYDDLPRIVTGQTIIVEIIRVDANTGFTPTVSAWATPMATARPALTVINYVPISIAAATGVGAIALQDIPPDATHFQLAMAAVATGSIYLLQQTINGVVFTNVVRASTPAGFPQTPEIVVPLLRQATTVSIAKNALVAETILGLFLR